MVLGHSRWLWGHFVVSQNLQSVLRCHTAAFSAIGGVPEEIFYDRMNTTVIGEDEAGVVTYNASLVALLNPYGAVPRACQPYRAKTKGKIERPFRYIRQDFFLTRTFRNMDDLNAQFDIWRSEVANPRVHATTRCVVDEAFAEELPSLKPLPAMPYSAVLTAEQWVSKEGMIFGQRQLLFRSRHYPPPDARGPAPCDRAADFRRRAIGCPPSGSGRQARRRVDPAHRKAPPKRRGRPPKARNGEADH